MALYRYLTPAIAVVTERRISPLLKGEFRMARLPSPKGESLSRQSGRPGVR